MSVDFDADGNLLVTCSNGGYMLIEMQYRKKLLAEIAKFCDNNVIFQKTAAVTDSELDKQLKGLANEVQFETKNNTRR